MSNGQQASASAVSPTPKTAKDFIKAIQQARSSKVLCYIVSTREGAAFQIADDAVREIYNHLAGLNLKKEDKLDLFIHSNGGAGTVPWMLVNLIREFTDNFEVLVPYRAFSAATLIALGANKICMHHMGMLGPIDPKVGNEFNPADSKGNLIPISVEDVASYVSFIKDQAGISHEDELIQAVNALVANVHPLALGNVHRFYAQSRMMARKLLLLHMEAKDEHTINDIVETLTSKLFFHGHPINRKEAAELKLKVEKPSTELENSMWGLYLTYEKEMEMNTPFNAKEMLNASGKPHIDAKLIGACIESESKKDTYEVEIKIQRPSVPQNAPIAAQIQSGFDAVVVPVKSGWKSH